MNDLQKLKLKILKEVDLNGECYDDWDSGFDAALRLIMEWIHLIEKESV